MKQRTLGLRTLVDLIKVELTKKESVEGNTNSVLGGFYLGQGQTVVRKYDFLGKIAEEEAIYDTRSEAQNEETVTSRISHLKYYLGDKYSVTGPSNKVLITKQK